MKEDIKYPYIGESSYGDVVLFSSDRYGKCLHGATYPEGTDGAWKEGAFKNITREYLDSTYGKVESKEHAGFIVELLTSNGAKLNGAVRNTGYFYTYERHGVLNFSFCKDGSCASSDGEKQITIPTPPKEVVVGEKKSEVYIPELNAVSSGFVVESDEWAKFDVIGGLDGSPSNEHSTFTPVSSEGVVDEWPKVGDEVSFPSGKGILTINKPDDNGVVIVECNDEDYGMVYKRVSLSTLQKPKTPEEELHDKLSKQLTSLTGEALSLDGTWIKSIADAIMNNKLNGFDITKKPQ